MFRYGHNRLEFKIILALTFVIACMISTYTYIDIQSIRTDTVRTLL